MLFPVPPASEQSAIVSEIGREIERINKLRAATERTTALLQERRSALIYAAVTGQLEIPEHAA